MKSLFGASDVCQSDGTLNGYTITKAEDVMRYQLVLRVRGSVTAVSTTLFHTERGCMDAAARMHETLKEFGFLVGRERLGDVEGRVEVLAVRVATTDEKANDD